jgi:hypothetical protein
MACSKPYFRGGSIISFPLFYLNPKYAKAKTGYYFIHSISTFLYFEKSILRVRSS